MNRGCGTRKKGGLYICTKLGRFGKPIEDFIMDPPLPYEGESFRTPQIFENGAKHLLVWVGAEFYEHPCDFIEEVRKFGASKRIPLGFPVEELSPGSLMFFVHSKAIIDNYSVLPVPEYCPKKDAGHFANEEYCIGHAYQVAQANTENGMRKVGDTLYRVYPSGIETKLEYRKGIFLRLPITDIDYVVQEGGMVDQKVQKKKRISKIPINLVDE